MSKRDFKPVRDPTTRQAAISVVRRLQAAGHEAMFAGGCVRDMLMRKRPEDYDVATSATPAEVVRLFRRTRRVGARFGVVLVKIGRHAIEVATFRSDSDYEDGRHPGRVHFTNAREDALRRDFTINGMFYDPLKREIVDHVGGRQDLKARLIRAIGDPAQRFAEDHLRILRAIRFAARFGFAIEPSTWGAMRREAGSISRISAERIREELDFMLSSPARAQAFAAVRKAGLIPHLWPGAIEILSQSDLIESTLAALPRESRFELALAVVLMGQRSKEAEVACNQLRCSNQTKREVLWLVRHRTALDEPGKLTLADLKLLMVKPAFTDLLQFLRGRLIATRAPRGIYRKLLLRVRSVPPEEVAPTPLLNGTDLKALGLPQGPLYKTVLSKLYYAQLNREIDDRASAVSLARRIIGDVGH